MTHFQPKFICVRQKQFFFVNENATTKNTLFQKCHIDACSTKEKYVSWLNPMFYYGNKNVILLGPHILKKKREYNTFKYIFCISGKSTVMTIHILCSVGKFKKGFFSSSLSY